MSRQLAAHLKRRGASPNVLITVIGEEHAAASPARPMDHLDVQGIIPTGSLDRVRRRLGGCCAYCGRRMVESRCAPHPLAETIEHLSPRAHGGTNATANRTIACYACNNLRGCIPLLEFLILYPQGSPDVWIDRLWRAYERLRAKQQRSGRSVLPEAPTLSPIPVTMVATDVPDPDPTLHAPPTYRPEELW